MVSFGEIDYLDSGALNHLVEHVFLCCLFCSNLHLCLSILPPRQWINHSACNEFVYLWAKKDLVYIFRPNLKNGRKASLSIVTFLLPDVFQLCSSYEMWGNFVHFSEKIPKILKISSGHVECSFDNLAEFFFREVCNLFAQSPKVITKLYFVIEKYASKHPSRLVERSFDNPVEKLSRNFKKFSIKFRKKLLFFFQ